jgi:hypothetical protein
MRARLWVMNADGSAQRNLRAIGDAYSRPSWSPDGRRLVLLLAHGLRRAEARGEAAARGEAQNPRRELLVGQIRYSKSARPGGTVLQEKPQARSERRFGTTISLVVSSGRL